MVAELPGDGVGGAEAQTAPAPGETHAQRAAPPRGVARRPALLAAGARTRHPAHAWSVTPRTQPDAQLASGTHTPDARRTLSRGSRPRSWAPARSALATDGAAHTWPERLRVRTRPARPRATPGSCSAGRLRGNLGAGLRSAHPEVPDMRAPPGPSGLAGRAATRRSHLPPQVPPPPSQLPLASLAHTRQEGQPPWGVPLESSAPRASPVSPRSPGKRGRQWDQGQHRSRLQGGLARGHAGLCSSGGGGHRQIVNEVKEEPDGDRPCPLPPSAWFLPPLSTSAR